MAYNVYFDEDGNPKVNVNGVEKTIGKMSTNELNRLRAAGKRLTKTEVRKSRAFQCAGLLGLYLSDEPIRQTEL